MIEFFSDTEFVFPAESAAKTEPVMQQIFSEYNRKLDYLHIIFMDDEQLLQINKEFLNHDYYTDIITFNYAEEKDVIEAELYISVERVRENAQVLAVEFQQELNRVIIHGVLHLCGYEDSTEKLKNEMQEAENKYINLIVSRETL